VQDKTRLDKSNRRYCFYTSNSFLHVGTAHFSFDEMRTQTSGIQERSKASGKLQRLQKEGAFLCCTEKRTKEKTLFDFLSSSHARLSPARPALEGKISKAEKDRGRGSSILFSSCSGSEKHSEGARPSFRWQKQKRSNPFGASGNPKTNSLICDLSESAYIN
jgi:hypothetical protein